MSPWSKSSDHFCTVCLRDNGGTSVCHMAGGALAVEDRARSTGVTSLATLIVRAPIARYKDSLYKINDWLTTPILFPISVSSVSKVNPI